MNEAVAELDSIRRVFETYLQEALHDVHTGDQEAYQDGMTSYA